MREAAEGQRSANDDGGVPMRESAVGQLSADDVGGVPLDLRNHSTCVRNPLGLPEFKSILKYPG